MANSTITFFPVGEKNGGMILIKLNDSFNTTIMIDCSIGDESIGDHCDVNEELRYRLPTESNKRPYVDAFILTHRHEDHLKGFQKHFHLGPLADYKDDDDELKIVIKELWSSHNFWKPSSINYKLCDNAKEFNKEMKRRVKLFEDKKEIQGVGDRAIIIGRDPDGRTNNLENINYNIGDTFTKINNLNISSKFSGYILSPIEQQEDEEDECFTDMNRQSVVFQLTVKQGKYENKLFMAADAECLVWETLWNKHKNNDKKLEYDILLAPHHCSWHSLSYDSQTNDDDPQLCENAKKALSQSKEGAFIVSQSKVIKDADQDPPSEAAKDEYVDVVGEDQFICTNEHPDENKPEPLEFNLTGDGPQKKGVKEKSKLSVAALSSTKEAYPHG
ncbi:metallohydrolase [bacterium]|nr:metallohydrolase [bacterium]